MQGVFPPIQDVQTLPELCKAGGSVIVQRGDYIFTEAHHGRPPRLAGRHEVTNYVALIVIFAELRRGGDAEVWFDEGGGGRCREQMAEAFDVHDGEGTTAATIGLKHLQGKKTWWRLFVAAVGMPRELLHRLGSGLVILTLKSDWVRAHVPKPALGCTMSDGKTVTMVFMKAQEDIMKVLAGVVCELEANLQDTALLKGLSNLANMAWLIGKAQTTYFQGRYTRRKTCIELVFIRRPSGA